MTATAPEKIVSPLRVALFGPFEVQVNGSALPRLRSRKSQWLFALLVLRAGRELERAWLAGTLWPDSPEAGALANLRNCLKDLRRAMGSEAHRLRSPTPHSLCLDMTGAEADVMTFDRRITQGDQRCLEEAVALYRGPLLEGCTEEWVFQERQAREQAYLQALESLALQAQARGEAGAAERYLRRAVSVDPLRETAQRALMQLLASSGNYAAATQVYRELRLLLHRELNAEPDGETSTLHQQLRAEARAKAEGSGRGLGISPRDRQEHRLPDRIRPERPFQLAAPAPPGEFPPLKTPAALGHNLPLQLTRFIGREREMAEVKQRLCDSRLVTLTGAGGCGKTRLSLEIAAELLPQLADGVWLVELAPLPAPPSGGHPALIVQAVAAALGMREGPERSLLEGLTDFLRGKDLLLVLDNCEHLLAACAPLAERLLRACSRLRILATSREALGINGETIYRVPSLSVPGDQAFRRSGVPEGLSQSPERLLQYEAVRLFTDRAAAAAPGFVLTNANAPAVAQVCYQLDGIPLALELAAARVRVMPVEQLARRLDDRFRLLTGGSRTALPRQQTLRALIDWSYDLLSEPEQVLLRRLSVFAGGWTLEAAEAVCSGVQAFRHSGVQEESNCDPEWPNARPEGTRPERPGPPLRGGAPRTPKRLNAEEVLDLLSRLADKSLVLYEEQHGEARYRLLETVRQYAGDRSSEMAEGPAVRERHAEFFRQLSEGAVAQSGGSERAAAFARLERELHNLRAALEWRQSTEAGIGAGLQLAVTLAEFWDHRGLYSEGRELLQGLLERAGEAPSVCRARGLQLAGSLNGFQGEYAAARSFLEAGLAIFRELGDQEGIAGTLMALARVVGWEGDPAAARRLTEAGLAIWRKLNDRCGLASALDWLGWQCYGMGDLAAARACFEERATISAELGDHAGPYYGLGAVATSLGEYETARPLLEKGLAMAREAGNMRVAAWGILRLGHVARGEGNDEKARACYEESLALAREMHLGRVAAESLHGLMRLALKQGDEEAMRSRAREMLTVTRDRRILAWCLECLAQAAMTWAGNAERAAGLLGAAKAMYEPAGEVVIPADQEDKDQCIAAARAALGEEAFAAAVASGRAMPLEQVVCLALEGSEIPD